MVSLLRRDPEVSREDTDLGTVPLAGRLVEDMTAVADMQVAEGNSAVERSPAEDKRAVEDKCQSRARAQTGAHILAEAVPDKE